MHERVSPQDYVHIWMTSATLSEVVRRVARELALPVTAGEVLLMAQGLRRAGIRIPVRPGGASGRGRVTLTRRTDGDYEDGQGRTAYPVGPGTPVEGPWDCARCRRRMLSGFVVLAADLASHWPVCRRCSSAA
jgi:hypothetical protein